MRRNRSIHLLLKIILSSSIFCNILFFKACFCLSGLSAQYPVCRSPAFLPHSYPKGSSNRISIHGQTLLQRSRRMQEEAHDDFIIQKDICSKLQERIESLEKKLEIQARVIKTLQKKTITTTKKQGRQAKTVTVNQKAVEDGSAVGCAALGLVVGRSVSRNLWLVGILSGAYAGSVLSKRPGKLGVKIRKLGLWVALKYKDLIDFYETTIYLYKTGMLGATYFKRWEKIDKQYKIMDKYNTFVTNVKGEYTKADMKYDITNKSKNLMSWMGGVATTTGTRLQKEIQTFDRKKKLTERLPPQIRGLFKSKKEYRDELLKEYRVKFCGQRKWRPFP